MKHNCAYCGDKWHWLRSVLDTITVCSECQNRWPPLRVNNLIALMEAHPTASAGALLAAWRKGEAREAPERTDLP